MLVSEYSRAQGEFAKEDGLWLQKIYLQGRPAEGAVAKNHIYPRYCTIRWGTRYDKLQACRMLANMYTSVEDGLVEGELALNIFQNQTPIPLTRQILQSLNELKASDALVRREIFQDILLISKTGNFALGYLFGDERSFLVQLGRHLGDVLPLAVAESSIFSGNFTTEEIKAELEKAFGRIALRRT